MNLVEAIDAFVGELKDSKRVAGIAADIYLLAKSRAETFRVTGRFDESIQILDAKDFFVAVGEGKYPHREESKEDIIKKLQGVRVIKIGSSAPYAVDIEFGVEGIAPKAVFRLALQDAINNNK